MNALRLAFLVSRIAYWMAAAEISFALQTRSVPGCPIHMLGDLAYA